MRRRTLLKVGAFGAAVLAAGGVALRLADKPTAEARLDNMSKVLRAVVPALLAGNLPADAATRARAIEDGLQRTLATIEGLPPPTRAELDELFALLASRPGRWLAGIESWESATPDAVAQFLSRWRTHSIDLFQTAYHALHDLVLGPWYADASTWKDIGYPGPIEL